MKVHCTHNQMVELSELKPHPKNRNKHPKEQIERLAKILKYQGWRYPVKVSKLSGFVTSGHGRIDAAKLNGWTSVPVNFQDYESEEQEYADVQADNAIASWAEMDLSSIHTDLPEMEPFDLDLLGIKGFELDPEPGKTDEDAIPENVPAISKLGDLYQLGNHRLLCGDSTDPDAISRLMNGEKADMVFTDPPYNHGSEDSLIASTVSQSMRRLKNSEWDRSFDIDTALATIDLVKSENSTVYICTSHHLAGKVFAWQAIAAKQGGYCVWVKPNPMPSLMKRHWTWDHELICYSTYGKHTFNFPKEGHAPASWVIQKNQVNDLHPTMKPVAVCEMAISHSSKVGDVVFDGYLGSGSTLIACEKTNRKCYGMEIDPHYCDVIIKRWEDYTGKKAEKVEKLG